MFDADGTLYDFKATEKVSLRLLFEKWSIPYTEDNIILYESGNHKLWDQYEKGLITQDFISHERFRLLFEALGIEGDQYEAGNFFIDTLAQYGYMIDGAREFLDWVTSKKDLFRNYIITNGIARTQYGRFRNSGTIGMYEGIFISGEIGAQKPQKEFFDIVFRETGADPARSIVIGDSEKSDIQGAVNAGIRSIFLDFSGKKSDLATWSVSSFKELEELLLEIDAEN